MARLQTGGGGEEETAATANALAAARQANTQRKNSSPRPSV
jgi:hypothetical protein